MDGISFLRKVVAKSLVLTLAILFMARVGASEDEPLLIVLEPEALAADLGAGGFTVLGTTYDGEAFYWMPSSGVVRLGGTQGVAISRDGRTIVGNALNANGHESAAIWLGETDWRVLGSFHPNALPCDRLLSASYGASDDGRVIVGLGWDGCRFARAFRWEESTGMVNLGSTVSGRSSRANNISGDGRVVIGWQEDPFGFRQAARWVDGRQEVLSGPNGILGEARGINTDGSIIVGGNCQPVIQMGWIWRREGGVTCYPPPRPRPAGFQVLMMATSEDGRVVGGAHSFGLESESILWIDGEPHYLKDYLREHGIPDAFEGWVNTGFINAVSPDGRVLAGFGAGPTAFTGFVVILEEP
jgi:probable HAF family extracellular repeat protein